MNELEWVEGQILGNVWLTECIARIDPRTGEVTAWITFKVGLCSGYSLSSWGLAPGQARNASLPLATVRLGRRRVGGAWHVSGGRLSV